MLHNLLLGFRCLIEGDVTNLAVAVKTQGFGQLLVSCLVDWVEILARHAVNEEAELSIFIDELEILVSCGSWWVVQSNVPSNDEPFSIAVNVVQILCTISLQLLVILLAVRLLTHFCNYLAYCLGGVLSTLLSVLNFLSELAHSALSLEVLVLKFFKTCFDPLLSFLSKY